MHFMAIEESLLAIKNIVNIISAFKNMSQLTLTFCFPTISQPFPEQ